MNLEKKTKQNYRDEVEDRVGKMSVFRRAEDSLQICAQLAGFFDKYGMPERIMAFWPDQNNGDVDIWPIINLIIDVNDQIIMPSIQNKSDGSTIMIGHLMNDTKMPDNYSKIIDVEDIDMVIVPGRAFDLKNNRVGRGFGHYDRFLTKATNKLTKIGVAFSNQIYQSLPIQQYDVKMSRVIFNRR